ncbi:MAG: DUF948 domain-containing protein [Pseudanabaenaceae cyanobacterium bins.39]|nr:DUF948 domain-containing protein [Pseudanabaenaceae cyanobacterium bins.39]
MPEAIFLLGLSFLLVVICLTVLLVTAIPTFQALGKAANSIVRLADTLTRELPATLDAIRMTGLELSELSDELNQGAKNAGEAVKQVNDGIKGVRQTASSASIATKSAFAGIKAGLKSLGRPRRSPRSDRRVNASEEDLLEQYADTYGPLPQITRLDPDANTDTSTNISEPKTDNSDN